MFGLGMPELIVIGVILLVIFGPSKIPQLGSSLGSAIKNFRQGSEEGAKPINQEDKKGA
jgi:sec-independent protein translocase protein TatA